jgi:hypothetical protein
VAHELRFVYRWPLDTCQSGQRMLIMFWYITQALDSASSIPFRSKERKIRVVRITEVTRRYRL